MPAALFLPLLVCTRSVAACKAAQAVRGSSVKLEGRDVLSTWKIMVSLVTRTRTLTLTRTLTPTLTLTLTSRWSVR